MESAGPIAFQWQEGALVRASTVPGGLRLDVPEDLEPYDGDRSRAWLRSVWDQPEVREVIAAASPVLYGQVEAVIAGRQRDRRRVRRTVLSIVSYLLRWQRRPTPFALFAGVAPVQIGGPAAAGLGDKHATSVRADADWLADVVSRLEACAPLRERLPVAVNNCGQVRGNRYVVPGAPADGRSVLVAPAEVSVQHSRPVAAAVAAAGDPIPYGDLRERLLGEFPGASRRQIEGLLAGLLANNVLISGLWAPLTVPDALVHVCDVLTETGAAEIAEVSGLIAELCTIRDELVVQAPAAPWTEWARPADRMRAVSDVAPMPLVIDTALDAEVVLPEQVARDAAEAAAVLYRLSPYPFGYPHWRDYHRAFRARYGPGAVVPVTELVADSGLGLPAGYLGAAAERGPRQLTDRDETLLALVQQAVLDGSDEIVLTRRTIARLAVGDDGDLLPVLRAELAFEIWARTPVDLDTGSYRLVVTGTPRPGSSMAGRAAHLLDDDTRTALADGYAQTAPNAVAAQLSFPPRRRRNENVVRVPQLLDQVITLAEHRGPGPGVISLDDLAVTADARTFSLLQLSTGRRIEPRVPHALEAAVQTPPLARFLAELTTARSAVYKAFDFGAANRLPYLPRVRYKNAILSPARWLLTAADLPARTARQDAWDAALEAWRRRQRAPDQVAFVEHDQRLPIDLTHPVHRALLRNRLDSAGRLELRETADPGEYAWIGRPHEILLPLTGRTSPTAPVRSSSVPIRQARCADAALPGRSSHLHAGLYGHPDRFGEILTDHLPTLLAALTTSHWWYDRHRVMSRPAEEQHLDLTVRLPDVPHAYGRAAEQLHDWADELRRQRLLSRLELAAYQPQTGRFGTGPAWDTAEAVFAADSSAACAQLRAAAAGPVPAPALCAASMIDLAVSFLADHHRAMTWLVANLPRAKGPLETSVRDHALALAAGGHNALRSVRGGTEVADAWQRRASALAAYHDRLAEERDPATTLRSLLHQHHVRALGVDPTREAITQRLARTYAQRALALNPQDPQ